MFNLPQEPIFFHEGHRAFLENRDADVLNWDIMRLNLYRLKAGGTHRSYWEALPMNLFLFVGAIVMGGSTVLFLILAGAEAVNNINEHGLPHWRLIILDVISWGFIVFMMGFIIVASIVAFKVTLDLMSWPDRRIKALLHRVVQDGQLIKGQIISTELNRLNWQATYRFTASTGEELERTFYPDVLMKCPEGTPVWVLYLNDDISVLL